MAHSAIDVAGTLTRLSALTIFELRREWRRLHRSSPPMRLSRDLLARGIVYRLQERASGGLSRATLRQLEKGAAAPQNGGAPKSGPRAAPRPGTRLVREWRGMTHMVLVHADGVEWRGRRYASLTIVAREITGAHWSGPRFFGLTRRSAPSPAGAGVDDGES